MFSFDFDNPFPQHNCENIFFLGAVEGCHDFQFHEYDIDNNELIKLINRYIKNKLVIFKARIFWRQSLFAVRITESIFLGIAKELESNINKITF